MAAERPERLAEFDQLAQLRQKLNSRTRKRPDLEIYAKTIGGITNIQRIKKSELIDKIVERADELRDRIHEDWIERIDEGETIWKRQLNPKRRYYRDELINPLAGESKTELQSIAEDLGIRWKGKTAGQLISLIHQREQKSNNQDSRIPVEFRNYSPEIKTFPTDINQPLRKMSVKFYNIPADARIIATILNWALKVNVRQVSSHRVPENYTIYVPNTSGKATVSSYYKQNNTHADTRNGFILPSFSEITQISRGRITNKNAQLWLNRIDRVLQNIVGRSDEYAEIDIIEELTVKFRIGPMAGAGYVFLKKKVPNIFCPKCKKFCFFYCLQKAGVLTTEESHKIIQELELSNGIVSTKKNISQILPLMNTKVQIIVHKYDEEQKGFIITKNKCSRFPHGEINDRIPVHLGLVRGHYILADEASDLKQLTIDDFKFFNSKDDKMLSEIKTKTPLKYHDMIKTGSHQLWANCKEFLVTDEDIKRRIESYKLQDIEKDAICEWKDMNKILKDFPVTTRKLICEYTASRELCNLTVEQVKTMFGLSPDKPYVPPICSECKQEISWCNWNLKPTLDRLDNEKGHTIDNVRLTCFHCNVKKKDKENEIYFSDIETFPFDNHLVYNFGITKYENSYFQYDDKKCGELLYKATKYYYGLDAFEKLEDIFLAKSAKNKELVDKKFNNWLKWKLQKYPNISESVLQEAKDRKMSELIRNHRTIYFYFNGSKFDIQFIWKSKRLKFEKVIDSFGIIYLALEGELVVFYDMIRLTGIASLASLCRDYNLPPEYSKTEFPIFFPNRNNLDYFGVCPEAKYWPSGEIPDEQLGNKEFNMKETSIDYQIKDCVSTTMIFHKLYVNINKITGLDIRDFITISQLGFQYTMEQVPPRMITLPSERKVDSFDRESIQGGSTYPQIGETMSKSFFTIYNLWKTYQDEYKSLDTILSNQCFSKKARHLICGFSSSISQTLFKQLYDLCDDGEHDLDGVSLYPSAMILYDYPCGEQYWEQDLDMVCRKLNECDESLPLGIVECIISPDSSINPDTGIPNQVCPLLSHHSEEGNLLYTLTPNQLLIKTTIDLMEAVRYNKAVINKVIKAHMWKDKYPLFRKGMTKLFKGRKNAKDIGNPSLSQTFKLLMNSGGYGRMGMKYHDTELVILDEEQEADEIDKYYIKGNVIQDDDLANEKQCLLEVNKNKMSKVTVPAYLASFILAYGRKIMNKPINAIDGFTNWNTTFRYRDTDSLFVSEESYQLLKKRCPEIIGKGIGQLHDDIEEVDGGKIIRSIFLAPKTYLNVIIGYSKEDGDVVVTFHIRAKGIDKRKQKTLTLEEYELMLREGIQKEVPDTSRLAKSFRNANEPPIKTVIASKNVNKTRWKGRNWDGLRYLPIIEEDNSKEEKDEDVEEEE
jgi:hypothetical protein